MAAVGQHHRRFYTGSAADLAAETPAADGIGALFWETDSYAWYTWDGSSWLATSGGFVSGIVSATEAYEVAAGVRVVLCDATGGAFSVTLPAVADSAGRTIEVKKIDSSANAVTVDGNGAEEIDGETTQIIIAQYDAMLILCDGSDWHII